MSEPGICPICGSDQITIVDARALAEAMGRRRCCRACGNEYRSVALTDTVGELRITVETIAPRRMSSLPPLRRMIKRLRAALSH